MTSLVAPTNQDPSVLKNFQSFLISKNYSSSTIRNYLSDIGSYFDFAKNSNPFSLDTLSSYLKTISSDSNYRRYLSSLSKFFKYALDQGLTKTNHLKAALRDKKPNLDEILTNYQEFLGKKKSESTIRNYLNDIRQFVDWSTKSPDSSAIAESSAPFDESGSEKKSFKFKFLIPLLPARRSGGSKGKAASAEGDLKIEN